MPCRDAAAHLPAAIASVQGQTFGDYEVIAVDDGSADETFRLLYAWAQRDGRVRVMQTHGRGLVGALASALAAARGDLVARMDADDLAASTRLEKQIALLEDDPRIAACGTGVEYFPPEAVRDGARRYESWLNGLNRPDDIARDIFIECPLPHPTLMARRSTILGVGGYRELGWPEDYDLVLRLWTGGYRMAKVPEVLHRWRESPHRTSRTDDRYRPESFLRLKIHFLTQSLLAGGRSAVIWGAGTTGKRLALGLIDAGTPVVAFVEVDPDKVGQTIHGAPVLSHEDIGRFARAGETRDDALVIGAVGNDGARAEIRDALVAIGMVELDDFAMVA